MFKRANSRGRKGGKLRTLFLFLVILIVSCTVFLAIRDIPAPKEKTIKVIDTKVIYDKNADRL